LRKTFPQRTRILLDGARADADQYSQRGMVTAGLRAMADGSFPDSFTDMLRLEFPRTASPMAACKASSMNATNGVVSEALSAAAGAT
jgi:hypothetical protein